MEGFKKATEFFQGMVPKMENSFNPAERIRESSEINPVDANVSEFNPDIRIKDIKQLGEQYTSELRENAACTDTISPNLDISKFEKVDSAKVAELRSEFNSQKPSLRREWEEIHDREWPKYADDVYDKNGILIRKAGDYYDAHHEQPLSLGGKNEATNITPMHCLNHREIHKGALKEMNS